MRYQIRIKPNFHFWDIFRPHSVFMAYKKTNQINVELSEISYYTNEQMTNDPNLYDQIISEYHLLADNIGLVQGTFSIYINTEDN